MLTPALSALRHADSAGTGPSFGVRLFIRFEDSQCHIGVRRLVIVVATMGSTRDGRNRATVPPRYKTGQACRASDCWLFCAVLLSFVDLTNWRSCGVERTEPPFTSRRCTAAALRGLFRICRGLPQYLSSCACLNHCSFSNGNTGQCGCHAGIGQRLAAGKTLWLSSPCRCC
jgi:hypothetical protein